MGRTVTKVDTAPVWYMPDIDDNRKDPEPFKVLISPLTAGEMSRARHAMYAKVIRESNGDGSSGVDYDTGSRDMIERLLGEHIHEVANYNQRDAKTGRVVSITTGIGLVESELSVETADVNDEVPVLDDIWEALQKTSKLQEGVSGNFEGRPDSSEPPTSGASKPESGSASTSTASAGVVISGRTRIQTALKSNATNGDAPAI